MTGIVVNVKECIVCYKNMDEATTGNLLVIQQTVSCSISFVKFIFLSTYLLMTNNDLMKHHIRKVKCPKNFFTDTTFNVKGINYKQP